MSLAMKFVGLVFHHRVAPRLNVDHCFIAEFRRGQIERAGTLGEGRQHIQFGHCGGDGLQGGKVGLEHVQQAFVEQLLACQRALRGGQRLVLEGLQFRRDIALGIFQGLAAAVIVRHIVRIGAADLDVEAVHPVVFDLEIGDAAAFALAGFQLEQELAAVALDGAQLVQFGVEAGGDDAAFAQHAAGLGHDRLPQCVGDVLRRFGRKIEFPEPRAVERVQDGLQLGQQGQAVAQAGQVARAGAAQGDAAGDALDVGALAQDFVDVLVGCSAAIAQQGGNGILTAAQGVVVAQRVVQPVAQRAAAHAGGAGVEHGEQGGRSFAAQGFADFQIAPRRGVEQHIVAFAFHAQALDVGQLAALRVLGIFQQGAGGGNRRIQTGTAEAIQIAGAKLRCQLVAGGIQIELPACKRSGGALCAAQGGMGKVIWMQDFRGAEPFQRRAKLLRRDFHQREAAAGQIQPGHAELVPVCCHGQQQAVALVVEQGCVGERAGRDDARHLALHRAFGGGRVADLLADGDRLAQLDQLGEILLGGVIRHARHLDRLACRGATGGERDAQELRRPFRIAEKQLVKIPHAVKQQHAWVFRLDAQVLLHHGGVFFHIQLGFLLYDVSAGFFIKRR